MTTNTTNSQAPEILAKQVAEWRKEVARLNDLIAHAEGRDSQAASIDTPEFRKRLRSLRNITMQETMDIELNEICDDIDAKLAQAREEGILFERKRLVQTIGNANDLSSECLKQRDEANARAIAAESRLAEIQRGVEGLVQHGHYYDADDVNNVLALLQPQGQADTSGLPG